MTKQIVNEWERLGIKPEIEIAYSMAEAIEYETEKYPLIDPLFMLALGCIESAFNEKTVSPAGAIGVFQIMPATGRLLCECFNLAYNDSLLFGFKTNARFSAKLLDVLIAQYNSNELVLADYNGGPYQAYYYQNYKNKLSDETRFFIPNVCQKYKLYKDLFETYRIDSTLVTMR
jgi:soluble lytic murein transglycosylase